MNGGDTYRHFTRLNVGNYTTDTHGGGGSSTPTPNQGGRDSVSADKDCTSNEG